MNVSMLQEFAELQIGVRGRFRAMVHKGHTYDEHGNIVKEGEVVVRDGVPQETPFGPNVVTLTGFNAMFNGTLVDVKAVMGLGNTTPTEGDTVLTSYKGFTTNTVSSSTSKFATPDGDGMVHYKQSWRWTFNPGALGSGTMNLAEAGTVPNGTINATTPILSHGLLVDGAGNPTTVSYNATEEYVDLFWDLEIYVPVSVTGTVSIDVDDGTGPVPTNFNFEVRPMLFSTYWASAASNYLPNWLFSSTGDNGAPQFSTGAAAGPLGSLDGSPTGYLTAGAQVPSVSSAAYVPGSKQRALTVSWIPSRGNVAGGIGAVGLSGANLAGSGQRHLFQISYSPKLAKTAAYSLSLNFLISMANK